MTKDSKYLIIGLGTTVLIGTLLMYFLLRKKVKCSDRFLFIGDSNTAGSNSFADQFMKVCKNDKNKKIAKSGAKTDWMLEQLSKELDKNQYDVVTILAGSNDIFATLSIDKAKKNMDLMLQKIKQSGAKSIVITPPYKGFYPATKKTHWELIKRWNSYLKQHPQPIEYIDFSQIVRDKSLFLSDGQHVNSQGHKLLANAYLKKLKVS